MPNSYSIPHLYASGTHYDVGFETGKTFKSLIEKYLSDRTEFGITEKIIPFIQTENGRKIYDSFLQNQIQNFPWYVDEIKGMADGSGLSFELLFTMNLRVELNHLSSNYPENCEIINGKECTDYHLVNESNHLLIHNEDSTASVYKTCYLATFKIVSKDYNGRYSPTEEFTCYCYPGHLPGNGFGHNKSGFVFGVNALYPHLIAINRTPRQFINRAIMGVKSLEELENIFLNVPISYGVCLNIAYCGKDLEAIKTNWNSEFNDEKSVTTEAIYPCSWCYEIAPNKEDCERNIVSKRCIISKQNAEKLSSDLKSEYFSIDFLSHFNQISINQILVPSSIHREIRTKELKVPKTKDEILELASDTGDAELPIYRDVSPTDNAKTVATALYDIKNANLKIYFGKPNGDYDMQIQYPI